MSPNSKKVPESTFLHDFNSSIKSDEQPTKELIRQWLMDRQNHPRPLPTIEQVKSELGWHFSKSLTAHREGIEKMNCFHDKPTQADIAMTRLKETTKYGSSTEAQMVTEDDVRAAIHRNEFIPFFQPKIDLATGISSCVEMLARWNHPELGILPPSQFIELIESAGLIDEFTDNLFRQSLVSATNNVASGKHIGIAINFSLLSLQNLQAPFRICSLLNEYGFPYDQITIEVTESANSENLSSVIKSLTTLRSQGFKISIDDFGTGYSSLKLLSKIPFTELKIDRMFVAGISENKKLTDILESIVHLAEKLNLSTVAEGIETRAQLDFLRRLGCNVGQGFYLGSPTRDFEATSMTEDARLTMA